MAATRATAARSQPVSVDQLEERALDPLQGGLLSTAIRARRLPTSCLTSRPIRNQILKSGADHTPQARGHYQRRQQVSAGEALGRVACESQQAIHLERAMADRDEVLGSLRACAGLRG
jgi:hypothetical protein